MNYTIAMTRDIYNRIEVNFDKTGNKYLVGLYNKNTKEYTHKTFDTIEDGLQVYQKFVEAIITGRYSYEDRKSWLR